MENKRLKTTIYLAGAIESASTKEMKNWRAEIREKLIYPSLGIYDPVEQETLKVGRDSKSQCEYIANLKRGGAWDLFSLAMDGIWWGKIDTHKVEKMNLLTFLYNKARLEGNYATDFPLWGDFEAVVRSDWICAYMPKDVKTVGTILEIFVCYLFSIPVYLILPDQSKTDTNSTLIDIVMKSGGQIFYNISECVSFIKTKYKLGE